MLIDLDVHHATVGINLDLDLAARIMTRDASLLQGFYEVTRTLSLTLGLVDSFLEDSHCVFGRLPHHIYHMVILANSTPSRMPLPISR